jgi:hypothetical protein
MSTYTVSELLLQWQRGSITAEQAIGHMLQHLALLYERDGERAGSIATLKASQEDLANRVAGTVEAKPTRRRRT